MGLTANNSILGAGGFNSYLYGNPDIYLFNISQADKPRWVASADPPRVRGAGRGRGGRVEGWEEERQSPAGRDAQLPCESCH